MDQNCSCFNCILGKYRCLNNGKCSSQDGLCHECPAGFGGQDCGEVLCGGLEQPPDSREPLHISLNYGAERRVDFNFQSSFPDKYSRESFPSSNYFGESSVDAAGDHHHRHQQQHQVQKQCKCLPGWTGVNCNVCTSQQACVNLFSSSKSSSPHCFSHAPGYPINRRNQPSFQSCGLENTRLIEMLGGIKGSATFECNRVSEKCIFQFWLDYKESFFCSLDGCDFDRQTTNVTSSDLLIQTTAHCSSVKCECIPGRMLCGAPTGPIQIDIGELLREEVKGPASLQCRLVRQLKNSTFTADDALNSDPSADPYVLIPGYDDHRYNCEFDEPGLRNSLGPFLGSNPVIELNCAAGECLIDSTELPIDAGGRDGNGGKHVDLTVVGSIVGSVILFLIFGVWALRRLYRKMTAFTINDGGGADAGFGYGRGGLYSYRKLEQQNPEDEDEELIKQQIKHQELEISILQGHHVPATLLFKAITYEIPSSSSKTTIIGGNTQQKHLSSSIRSGNSIPRSPRTPAVADFRFPGGKMANPSSSSSSALIQQPQPVTTKLLRGISGIVKPGELMAIMGSSGAGKTTCLDILAGKSKLGQVSGELLINGHVPTRAEFKRISGYVDQQDNLLPTLTVYETLLYSALLRLPRFMKYEMKVGRVRATMVELGIEHVADVRIGGEGGGDYARGISGGEKRRVSIAMEITTSPSLLYLDECTSGLDSFNAWSVVWSLRRLARQYNRTVLMSIHQPRSNIFSMFDKLLLLAEGGFMVYSGRLGRQSAGKADGGDEFAGGLTSWLKSMNLACPQGYNMADYLIDLTKTGSTLPNHQLAAIEDVPAGESNINQPTSPSTPGSFGANFDDDGPSGRKYGGVDAYSLKPTSKAALRINPNTGLAAASGAANSSSSGTQQQALPREAGSAGEVTAQQPEALPNSILSTQLPGVDFQAMQELSWKKPHLYDLIRGFIESECSASLCAEMDEEMELRRDDDDDDQKRYASSSSAHHHHHNQQMNGNLDDASVSSDDDLPIFSPRSSHSVPESITTKISQAFYHVGNSLLWAQSSSSAKSHQNRRLKASLWTQFKVLSWRTLVNFYRNPLLMYGHYGISIVLALFCGGLFWQVEDTLSGFQNRLGLFFFILAVFGFGSLTSLEVFSRERSLFIRERANGFYGVGVYYITKIFFDILPLRVVPPLLMGSVAYYMVGLAPGMVHFVKFLITLVLFNLAAAGICLIIAVACGNNLALANLVAVMVMLFSMLFGGFLLNKEKIPGAFDWLKYLSIYNYAFEALIVNELRDISLEDRQIGIPIQVPGQVILKTFGFNVDGYWGDTVALGWMILVFLGAAWIILQVFVKEKR